MSVARSIADQAVSELLFNKASVRNIFHGDPSDILYVRERVNKEFDIGNKVEVITKFDPPWPKTHPKVKGVVQGVGFLNRNNKMIPIYIVQVEGYYDPYSGWVENIVVHSDNMEQVQ